MPAKRSRKPSPSRDRTPRPKAAASSNGSRGRARSGSRRGAIGRVEEFTRMLQEERKRLRDELSEMEEHQVKTEEKPIADAAGYEDDLVDIATETFEREKALALESSVQCMLTMVEEALQKHRNGTYVICEV